MNSRNRPIALRLERSVAFVDAVFKVIESKGTEMDAATILRNAEKLHGIEFLIGPAAPTLIQIPISQYSAIVEDRMHKFLSASHLVIGSAEYARLHVVISGTYTYEWTHREWSHMIGNWANQVKWLGEPDWSYLDFYGGPNDRLIENYNIWCATVMKVIERKSNIL